MNWIYPFMISLLSLIVAVILFVRYWKTKDVSTAYWSGAFLMYFLSYGLSTVFVGQWVVFSATSYFATHFVRQTFVSLLFVFVYLGVIRLLTERKLLTIGLPLGFFLVQTYMVWYFDYIVKNIQLADQYHVIFFDIPFNLLIAVLFWKYYMVSRKKFSLLISIAWFAYTLVVPVFFYTAGNVALFMLSLVPMIIMVIAFALYYKSPTGQAIFEVTPVIERRDAPPTKYTLKSGATLLVEEETSAIGFDAFTDSIFHGIRGLCVTRLIPTEVQKIYGVHKSPVLWLTHTHTDMTVVDPGELEQLFSIVGKFIDTAKDQHIHEVVSGATNAIPSESSVPPTTSLKTDEIEGQSHGITPPVTQAQPPQTQVTKAQPPQTQETKAQPPQTQETKAQPPQTQETKAQPPQTQETKAQPPQTQETKAQPPQTQERKAQPTTVPLSADQSPPVASASVPKSTSLSNESSGISTIGGEDSASTTAPSAQVIPKSEPNKKTTQPKEDSKPPAPQSKGTSVASGGISTIGGESSTSATGIDIVAKKSSDAKSSDAKSSDAKSSDAKSSDAKSSDAKSSDAKSSDAKSSDAKSSDAKSSDAKSDDISVAKKPVLSVEKHDSKKPLVEVERHTQPVGQITQKREDLPPKSSDATEPSQKSSSSSTNEKQKSEKNDVSKNSHGFTVIGDDASTEHEAEMTVTQDESQKSVILLDGLEYLITNNNFNAVLHVIQLLKDKISLGDSVLLVPINPQTMDEQHMSILRQEFEILGTKKST